MITQKLSGEVFPSQFRHSHRTSGAGILHDQILHDPLCASSVHRQWSLCPHIHHDDRNLRNSFYALGLASPHRPSSSLAYARFPQPALPRLHWCSLLQGLPCCILHTPGDSVCVCYPSRWWAPWEQLLIYLRSFNAWSFIGAQSCVQQNDGVRLCCLQISPYGSWEDYVCLP